VSGAKTQRGRRTRIFFVQRSLALYPDVLDEARFVPARYAHIQSVIKTYYLSSTAVSTTLRYLPESERLKTTREEYRVLLANLRPLSHAPSRRRAELETAVTCTTSLSVGDEREQTRPAARTGATILPPERRQSIPT
jgi:hypothetical protein